MNIKTIMTWSMYFYIYCFIGWCWESSYVSLKEKRFVNRGFLGGPFLPIYGCGAVVMLLVSRPFQSDVILVFFSGLIGATILEYITGVCMESLFKIRYWDYSNQPFNFQGQICLSSSLCWGLFTVLLTNYVHKPIAFLINSFPQLFLFVATLLITTIFVSDLIITFREAMDLRHLLEDMTRAKEELDALRQRLDSILENTSSKIGGKWEGLKLSAQSRSEELFGAISKRLKSISEYMGDLTEEQINEFTEYRKKFEDTKKLKDLRKTRITFIKRNLIKGNPHAKSRYFEKAFNELREYVNSKDYKKDQDSSSK